MVEALLPPLAVAGLLAGGGHGTEAADTFTLALTNMTCINLAVMTTFFLQKVRPTTWWEAEGARRATRLADTLRTPAEKAKGNVTGFYREVAVADQPAGTMFWFNRKRFAGSYWFLIFASRA